MKDRLTLPVALGATLVALLWSLCYSLITIAVAHGPALTVAALRAGIAGGFLIVVSLLLGRGLPRRSDWAAIVSVGLSATTLGIGSMFLAGGRVSPGIAEVIANSQPFMTAILGYFVLSERLGRWQVLGMVVAFAGIGLVAGPSLIAQDGTSTSLGIGFVLLGALGTAIGNVQMKRYAAADPLLLTAWQITVGGLALAVGALVTGSPWPNWSTPFTWALIGLALPGTAFAFVLWFALLKRAPLNRLNVFSFLVPIFGLGLARVFFDERLSPLQIAGVAFVLIGAGIAGRR